MHEFDDDPAIGLRVAGVGAGYPGWSMPICEMVARVGGKYRCRWRSDEGGQEFGFSGEILEIALHSRIVHTQ